MADFISREAAIALTDQHCFETSYDAVWMEEELRNLQSADVRPVAEISDAVYDAMYYLNSVSSQMPYHVYSALFDLILGILPTCGADMRESNLDATKGGNHD